MEGQCDAWMQKSIILAQNASNDLLRVGAILVSSTDELLCSAYSGENNDDSWCKTLLRKINTEHISSAHTAYITVNTLDADNEFDLNRLIEAITIDVIYIGIPDPTLTSYRDDDPVIKHDWIHRFSDELQITILEQNTRYYATSQQSITNSPYYAELRISRLVQEKLAKQGFTISQSELRKNKNADSLVGLLCAKYHVDYDSANTNVKCAISEAFNTKYGAYNYTNDTRSVDCNWRTSFFSFYRTISDKPISALAVINVGVGAGHEAVELFSDCLNVTFVDIAKDGLEKIREAIPSAITLVASAANLSAIPDGNYDLYISLRTYNSSFFNIKNALVEAHRVLKSDATIIISVANGFLCGQNHSIIPGLIIPRTDFVDIYRGIDIGRFICLEMQKTGFNNIQMVPTPTEIYLSAKVKEKL